MNMTMPLSELYWKLNALTELPPEEQAAVAEACRYLEETAPIEEKTCPEERCVRYGAEDGEWCAECSRCAVDRYDRMVSPGREAEAVFGTSDQRFLELHATDDGYSYSTYKDFKLVDGGTLERPDLAIGEAAKEIMGSYGFRFSEAAGDQFLAEVAYMEKIRGLITDLAFDQLVPGTRYAIQARFTSTGSTVWYTVLTIDDYGCAYRGAEQLRHLCPEGWWRVRETDGK